MRRIFLTLIILVLLYGLSLAQDPGDPSPEFLYRDDHHLFLVQGYTGETAKIPFESNKRDKIEWSPDGQFLLVQTYEENTYSRYCINLYDFEEQEWVYNEPISCGVSGTLFYKDGNRLVFSTADEKDAWLYIHNLSTQSTVQLYETKSDSELMPHGVGSLAWSPSKRFLLFESYTQIMGGTLNTLIVRNMETGDYFELNAPNSYYAYYDPNWSPDENWFLIELKEEYVTSGTLPRTNHQGDIYLVNTKTGEKHRLTYTPTLDKYEVHWTEDGQIAFTEREVILRDFSLSIDDALAIEEVPREDIVMPEPIDINEELEARESSANWNIILSPDSEYGAWVTPQFTSSSKDNPPTELNFGVVYPRGTDVNFSIPLSDSYQSDRILIGWRPSAYPYGAG